MVDEEILNWGEPRTIAETDEVVLDEISIPTGSIITSFTSRFESKLTFGDYSQDSDQLLSTWIQNNWSGGMLVDEHSEGATEARTRWGEIWTMNATQLALPPLMHEIAEGTVAGADAQAQGPIAMPLIEIHDVVYIAFGKELWTYTTDRFDFNEDVVATKVGDLAGYAQSQAVVIDDDDEFYIPLGINGVQKVNSHTHATPHVVAAATAGVKAIELVVWDRKLIALTTDRYLRIFQGGAWDAVDPELRLPHSESARGIELFWNQNGDESVYIVSDRKLWAFDYENMKIYPSSMSWPKFQSNGLGLTAWRDDALYISSGMAVTRYTRDGVRTDMGLDRDDGVSPDVLLKPWGKMYGHIDFIPSLAITSMAGTQNFIAATLQLGCVMNNNVPVSSRIGLAVWNESGWHVLWVKDIPLTPAKGGGIYPTGLMVTESVGGYRVWFGTGAIKHGGAGTGTSPYSGTPTVYTMGIPRDFHSPRHDVLSTIGDFAPTGYLETGWMDASMAGFRKTWSHIEFEISDPGDGLPMGGTVSVEYRTDDSPNTWNVLGAINDYGRHTLVFGEDDRGFPRGVESTAVDFRITLDTGDQKRTPIVRHYVLKFIKQALPGRAWQLSVPMESEQWKGMGPEEIKSFLARKSYEGRFSWFRDGDRSFRVRVSQVQIVGSSGYAPGMQIQVNLIEVPVTNHPVWGGLE